MIGDIGVALEHLVLLLNLISLVLDHIKFGIIFGELVLLLLRLTEVGIELMLLHASMLVTLGGVETRLIDHLCCIEAFPTRLHIQGGFLLFALRGIV